MGPEFVRFQRALRLSLLRQRDANHHEHKGQQQRGLGAVTQQQVDATGRQQHLAGEGDPGHEEADRTGTGGGAPVEMPEVGIQQQLAKESQVLVFLEGRRVG